jgi:hypothetical protein
MMSRLTRADKSLIIALVFVSLLGIAYPFLSGRSSSSVAHAAISVNGQVVRTIALDGHQETFRLTGVGGFNQIEVHGSRVRMVDTDCPDKLCINQGWISRIPQMIVCLPHRVVVRIVEGSTMNVDSIVR